jgi:hypothetical protein
MSVSRTDVVPMGLSQIVLARLEKSGFTFPTDQMPCEEGTRIFVVVAPPGSFGMTRY